MQLKKSRRKRTRLVVAEPNLEVIDRPGSLPTEGRSVCSGGLKSECWSAFPPMKVLHFPGHFPFSAASSLSQPVKAPSPITGSPKHCSPVQNLHFSPLNSSLASRRMPACRDSPHTVVFEYSFRTRRFVWGTIMQER